MIKLFVWGGGGGEEWANAPASPMAAQSLKMLPYKNRLQEGYRISNPAKNISVEKGRTR